MKGLIIDTETTGIDEEREVVELATYDWERELPTVMRFRPRKPIGVAAMAVHNIIPQDLEECPLWPGSWALPPDVEYICGHNVDFDWQSIGSPPVKRICTLALARQALPDLDNHRLATVIYAICDEPAIARGWVKDAHAAVADVALVVKILNWFGFDGDWEGLWQRSEAARVPKVMTFGKHKGTPVEKVPRDYVRWLLGQPDVDPYLRKAFAAGR